MELYHVLVGKVRDNTFGIFILLGQRGLWGGAGDRKQPNGEAMSIFGLLLALGLPSSRPR